MKTQTPQSVRFAGSISLPLALPLPTKARPVRRGNFWPGESFGNCTQKWNVVGVFPDQAVVLPEVMIAKDRSL